MIASTVERVYEDLAQQCKKRFDLDIYEATRINKGYLNFKWKICTNKGTFLLKQYDKERFKKYDWDEVIHVLFTQQQLRREGVACPSFLMYEGKVMHTTEQGENFTVMHYCEGYNVEAGKVNAAQMYELGIHTGKMHRLLNEGKSFVGATPHFIPPSKEARMNYWEQVHKEAEEWLQPLVELQMKATEILDYSLIERAEIGLAHRDLWVDNILFTEDGLSAILDFDRLHVDYPELDVARAIISCSLDGDVFHIKNVQAFLVGYRTERPFPKGQLVRAMWMLLYMEGKWWIHNNMYKIGPAPIRFAAEMVWLSKHCEEMERRFGEL
ncbi:phosphotransferase enzyme family protein [Priestia taiwanensis]|uniref:Aminoglycoside phosphotransferase domain-containing protein n=1 Tax=Priestia taiwanensis TaxID=1347902 RepID=A0A917EN69_9BACI|nr:phosphotransferase [Priestia taiwanensis]MBM7362018.1 homoserine kinase type II [Priestia taiwanensis]GGE58791.1 hypothetical protein GCM10007140_06430 [Priestia taiwanensis]